MRNEQRTRPYLNRYGTCGIDFKGNKLNIKRNIGKIVQEPAVVLVILKNLSVCRICKQMILVVGQPTMPLRLGDGVEQPQQQGQQGQALFYIFRGFQ